MEIPERIWHLMARVLNDEASPQETEELSVLLEQDESIQQQFELLTRIWNEKDHGIDDEGNTRKLILKIIDRAETETEVENVNREAGRKSRHRHRSLMASLFVILLTGGWFFFS